ncbi:hypothetical protein SETIT_6G113500v2 [Setaria italica]|uniref:Uncharacterized protein n=2 Tax=Setaria TaxID=4554 RepID=A0A368RKF5_SETIT|nr:hypothetical protein SETIT_6G113500v2 [Setaria italica]TKW09755.1 hypothetical protein SEVIR_6G123000v2 [Setaria viridis]
MTKRPSSPRPQGTNLLPAARPLRVQAHPYPWLCSSSPPPNRASLSPNRPSSVLNRWRARAPTLAAPVPPWRCSPTRPPACSGARSTRWCSPAGARHTAEVGPGGGALPPSSVELGPGDGARSPAYFGSF